MRLIEVIPRDSASAISSFNLIVAFFASTIIWTSFATKSFLSGIFTGAFLATTFFASAFFASAFFATAFLGTLLAVFFETLFLATLFTAAFFADLLFLGARVTGTDHPFVFLISLRISEAFLNIL